MFFHELHEIFLEFMKIPGCAWCWFVHSWYAWRENAASSGDLWPDYDFTCMKCCRPWHPNNSGRGY